MKRLLVFLFLVGIACVPTVFAQGKTSISVLGKDKGTVASMQSGGHMLVDAQATAKKIGGTVELFPASKQLKVAFPGMYGILSASAREAVINAQTVALPAEVLISGGKIYAPVAFFLLPQVQQSLNRQITFADNTLVVEKHFTLSLDTLHQQEAQDRIVLWRKGNVAFTSSQPNKHTVRVEFADTIIKRTVHQRPKDDLVHSFSLSQRGNNAVLEIILGKSGQEWKVLEGKGDLIVVVAATASAMTKEQPLPSPSVFEEPQDVSATTDLVPSVVAAEEEDAEELDLSAPATISAPVMNAVPPPVMTTAALPAMKAKDQIRIVVDPGHGGKDPGATRRGSAREKDLNLSVSKHLYNYLRKQGFAVKLTRTDDTFVTLAGRSKMANEFKADLFVSVHTNAARRTQANGFEVYFRSEKPTDKDAAEIAAFENEALQYEETHYNFVDKLLQSLAKNEYMNESSALAGHVRNYVYKEPGIGIAVNQKNSVKQANFYVLRGVQAPAILVEMGYISSPKDRARLNNKAVQKRMGEGIGKGVVAYLKQEGKVK